MTLAERLASLKAKLKAKITPESSTEEINEINDLTNGIFRQQVGYPLNTFFTKLSIDILEYHFGVQLKFEDETAITSSGKTIPCKGLLDAFLRIDIPIKVFGLNCTICVYDNTLMNIYTCDERNYPLEGRNFVLSFILSQDTAYRNSTLR